MIVCVERFTTFLVQFSNHLARVLVEQIDEALEHVQMECGRDEFAMRTPFVACTSNPGRAGRDEREEKKKTRIMNVVMKRKRLRLNRRSRIFNLNRCLPITAGTHTKSKRTGSIRAPRWLDAAIGLPVLISSPSPSHGLKKSYSADLSMYTWLLSISSTSDGLNRNTINFGPIHNLHTESKLYISRFSKMVRKTSVIWRQTVKWSGGLLVLGGMADGRYVRGKRRIEGKGGG